MNKKSLSKQVATIAVLQNGQLLNYIETRATKLAAYY